MTELEARELFGPFDEEKVTPEKRMGEDWSSDNLPPHLRNAKIEFVNHPPHYTSGDVECIDAIKSCMAGLNGFEGFCIGNAIKYLWRWKQKGGVTDLEKAKWYIDKAVEEQDNG